MADNVVGQNTQAPSPSEDLIVVSTERYACKECSKSFGRLEHLTRHSQSHTTRKSFRCPQCQKAFYRSDALIRHQKIHENSTQQPTSRSARACIPCSSGRRKCDRQSPCGGCSRRCIPCVFPSSAANGRVAALALTQDANIGSNDNFHQGRLLGPAAFPVSNESVQMAETSTNEHSLPQVPIASEINVAQQGNDSNQSGAGNLSESTTAGNMFTDDTTQSTSQNQWDPNFGPETYRGSWLEQNFMSINWMPDDWMPVLDFQGPPRGYISTQSLPPRDVRHDLAFGVPGVNDSTSPHSGPISVDSRRHWSQIDTPGASSNSDVGHSVRSQSSAGRLYVDSDGARLPRIRRALSTSDNSFGEDNDFVRLKRQTNFAFPQTGKRGSFQDTSIPQANQIPQHSYDHIYTDFQNLCVVSNVFSPYETSIFPELATMNECLKYCLLHFLPILPFLHPASIDVSSMHHLLILAMCATGSIYHDESCFESRKLTLALLELLRRSILIHEEQRPYLTADLSYLMAQVRMLSSIGSMYCGNTHLLQSAKIGHYSLVQYCKYEWSSASISELPLIDDGDLQVGIELAWKTWYEAESHRRLGYCIWLIDCMWMFHFGIRPLLSLEDATVAVPCQEVLWEAATAREWQQTYNVSIQLVSLYEVTQKAYLEKQMQSSMGEFSRILCIHALYHQTWQVKFYLQRPLNVWIPTAEKQSVEKIRQSQPTWLPGIPSFSKWRNSACDVLDILHWHANSVIGAASGMEHPTVLHLHLARVVLLTPFQEILDLAQSLVRLPPTGRDLENIKNLMSHIRRWALEDQYKARLAMIHAGVLFWHVRRYSTDAFYEPSAVHLATLALWAYATFARQFTNSDADNSDDHLPDYMQLDRPADDELVQLFVKRGSVMRAQITGVGNICSEKGPTKLLIEGKRLLGGLKRWNIARQLAIELGKLLDIGSDTLSPK